MSDYGISRLVNGESIYDFDKKEPVKISYDSFYKDSLAYEKQRKENTVFADIRFETVASLLSQDLSNLDDRTLYNVVRTNYSNVLSSIIDQKDYKFVSLFLQPRFIMAFNQVCGSVQLTNTEMTYICKLIYEYSVLDDKNDYIYGLYSTLARTIHRNSIGILCGLGIPEKTVVDILVSRHSCINDMINVKRVNNIIMNSDKDIMTEQRIVDLFSRIYSSITPLFIGTMYDVIPEYELDENSSLINSTISLAVLDLLNVIPSQDIRKVLINYANSYGINPYFCKTRFNLLSLSSDYGRIVEVVQSLQINEGIVLP